MLGFELEVLKIVCINIKLKVVKQDRQVILPFPSFEVHSLVVVVWTIGIAAWPSP